VTASLGNFSENSEIFGKLFQIRTLRKKNRISFCHIFWSEEKKSLLPKNGLLGAFSYLRNFYLALNVLTITPIKVFKIAVKGHLKFPELPVALLRVKRES